MSSEFWKAVWDSLWGGWIAALGVFLAVVLWLFPPSASVPLRWILPISVIAVLLMLALFDVAVTAFEKSRNPLPDVLRSSEPPPLTEGEMLLLLEPSDLFSIGTVVSVHYKDEDEFERLIGVGQVYNIQEDEKVVVTVSNTVPAQADRLNRVRQNDIRVLERLIVRPSVTEEAALMQAGETAARTLVEFLEEEGLGGESVEEEFREPGEENE